MIKRFGAFLPIKGKLKPLGPSLAELSPEQKAELLAAGKESKQSVVTSPNYKPDLEYQKKMEKRAKELGLKK